MNKRRIIIVGGLAAGPSAAAKAKRTNPNTEVILFEMGETVSYGICESPYAISGLISDENKLVIFSPEELQQEKGITVKTSHRVESISPAKHKISVRDLKKHALSDYEYDKLILTTGSISNRLNIAGEDARNVFRIKSREDTQNILSYLKSESPKNAVIIGGGYIGLEMAEAFRTRGLDVTMIHQFSLPMEGLELETREAVMNELEKNGIHFITNAKVEAFEKDKSSRVKYVLTNRGSYEADIVFLSLGVKPNVELAAVAKIRIGANGGILTDERQQTNIEDIYAAGDCCEVSNIISGKRMYIPLASLANRTGSVAGENAAGGRAIFKGAIRALAVKVFGLEVAQVGLSLEESLQGGFKAATELVTASTKVPMMPGGEKITIKLIHDQRSKRLLGANVFGGAGSIHRANLLGTAIQQKLTLDEVSRFDLIYSPHFAPLLDPIFISVSQAKKKS